MKDRWLAVNLSLLLPGLGQFYLNQVLKGAGFVLGFITCLGWAVWSILAANGNTVTGLWLVAIAATIYGFSLVDAHRGAQPVSIQSSKTKNVWYGVFLSQVLPGLGHLYLDRALIGGLFLILGVGLALWANTQSALIPLACSVWAVATYHTFRSAARKVATSLGLILLISLGLLFTRLTLGMAPVWFSQAVEQCIVPSESMLPTLKVSDRIFVRKAADDRPKTGDIVVFRIPKEAATLLRTSPDTLFVKRIIGLPGQQVQVSAGQVWINQQPLAEPYGPMPVSYEWGPAIIPKNTYFVLGDNRDASADSHVWGVLPAADLVGNAYKIYWPPSRIRPLN